MQMSHILICNYVYYQNPNSISDHTKLPYIFEHASTLIVNTLTMGL